MERLISVTDLNIKTKTKAEGRGSVVVTCLATTFVFRQEATGAPVAGALGAPAAGNNGGKRP